MFQQLATRLFFWRMYQKYRHRGWCIVSKMPELLNVAFPDASVQYFVSSFSFHDGVRLVGTLPSGQDVLYTSITTYDTLGNPVGSLFDDQIVCDKKNQYVILIGRDIKKPNTWSYSIVLRVYTRHPSKSLNVQMLPSLYILDKGSWCRLSQPNILSIMQETQSIQRILLKSLSTKHTHRSVGHSFFLPPRSKIQHFFVNTNAVYLVVFPRRNRVLQIDGVLPENIGRDFSRRYISFMACNLDTTQTDESIGFTLLDRFYRIWVAYSRQDAEKFGYSPGDHLLLWRAETLAPVLVYREVRTDNNGLSRLALEENGASSQRCARVMGQYYPKVRAF